jgi:ADP-heptose:LPS heptosyltransferase
LHLPNPRSAARLRLLQLAGRSLARVTPQPFEQVRSEPARRVLLIRPDHIGDVLLSSAAIGLLRAALPAAHLTYLVGPWSVDVARRGPPVDNIATLAFPGFTRRSSSYPLQPYGILLREAAKLRRQQFDMAVVLRPDHWWGALLALAAGIPIRVGARTPETAPLLSHACSLAPGVHAVEQALAIARHALDALGVDAIGVEAVDPPPLTFNVSSKDRADADALWLSLGLSGRVVTLQPSAGAILKHWPSPRWAELASRLQQHGFTVVLSGAPEDQAVLAAIAARVQPMPPPIAAGQSLPTSAAIFERCALLIAPDGGAAHLAAVVGTPTIRLYGPAPPRVFGPWPAPPALDQQVLITRQLACVPCGHLIDPPCGARTEPACMLAIGVDAVMELARRVLDHS